jgi:hypothetical protein
MTEKPRKESASAIAEFIREHFEKRFKEWEAEFPRAETDIRMLEQRYNEAQTPLEKRLRLLEWDAVGLDARETTSTTLLLSMISMVADVLAVTSTQPKPTQTELDELNARIEAGLQRIDEHIAKRLAKLLDSSGHEAMYGAGKK